MTCPRSHSLDVVRPGVIQGHVGAARIYSSSALRSCPRGQKQKKMMFLTCASKDLCPREQETEKLFSPAFGEVDSAQPQTWHFFEVSFYLKHSCKLGVPFGSRAVYLEMKTWL